MNFQKLFLLVSPNQFSRWSLPSKVGYISFWIGIVGLLITISTSYPSVKQYFQPSETTVRHQLENMLKERNFVGAETLLAKIERREDLRNTFNFYKGTFAIESNAATPAEPRTFFRKISPDSELIESAAQNERTYYSRLYGTTDKPMYYKKVGFMLDEMSTLGWDSPSYYALRVMVDSNSVDAFKKLTYWYAEFDRKYSKYLIKSTYDGMRVSTTGGPNSNFRLNPNNLHLVLVPEVYFYFAVNIALKSGGLCENTNEKRQALNIMQAAINARKTGGRPSIVKSLGEQLHMRYQEAEIENVIQWLSSMDKYCKS